MKPTQPIDLEQAVLAVATKFAREIASVMREDIAYRVTRALNLARTTMLAELDEPELPPVMRDLASEAASIAARLDEMSRGPTPEPDDDEATRRLHRVMERIRERAEDAK